MSRDEMQKELLREEKAAKAEKKSNKEMRYQEAARLKRSWREWRKPREEDLIDWEDMGEEYLAGLEEHCLECVTIPCVCMLAFLEKKIELLRLGEQIRDLEEKKKAADEKIVANIRSRQENNNPKPKSKLKPDTDISREPEIANIKLGESCEPSPPPPTPPDIPTTTADLHIINPAENPLSLPHSPPSRYPSSPHPIKPVEAKTLKPIKPAETIPPPSPFSQPGTAQHSAESIPTMTPISLSKLRGVSQLKPETKSTPAQQNSLTSSQNSQNTHQSPVKAPAAPILQGGGKIPAPPPPNYRPPPPLP